MSVNAAEINILEEIELDNPIFIEALPGLGHVGKLAADHMIDELNALKGKSEDRGGICNYEGGKEYYEYIVC